MINQYELLMQFLTALRDAKGAAKKAVLEEYKDRPWIKDFILYCMTPEVVLYQTLDDKLKQPLGMFGGQYKFRSTDFIEQLHEIIGLSTMGKTRGDEGVKIFRSLYSVTPKEAHDLIDCFILRNLKAGAGAKTINSVLEGWIDEFGYQRCDEGTREKLQKLLDESSTGTVIIQEKEDGMFLNNMTDEFGCAEEHRTRSGNLLKSKSLSNMVEAIAELECIMHNVMGECLVYHNGVLMDRASGNGKLNSIIQTGEDIGEEYEVQLKIWDAVPRPVFELALNSRDTDKFIKESAAVDKHPMMTYKDRLTALQEAAKRAAPYVTVVDSTEVSSVEEAFVIFKEILKRGGEGIVAKSPDGYWFDGTPKHTLKFKAIIEADFQMVEIKEGDKNGKYAETTGSVVFESSCGTIKFACSGLTDAQREDIKNSPSKWLGGIYAVRFNQLCTSQDEPDKFAVTFPRIISERRMDKLVADSHEEVVQKIDAYFDSI